MGIKDTWGKIKSSFVKSSSSEGGGVSFLQGKIPPSGKGKRELLENLRDCPVLYAVVNKIAENVANIPYKIYVIRKGGKAQKIHIKDILNKQTLKLILKQENPEEIKEHPLIDLLTFGNEFMNGKEIIMLTQIYLDLVGEAFWLLERNKAGVPIAIYPIPPTWVSRIPSPEYPFYQIDYYERKEIVKDDVIMFRKLNIANPYSRGVGIGETLGDEIDTDEFASEHTKAWFYNRARPDILIAVDGLKREDVQRLEVDWVSKTSGFWKWFKPYFINRNVQVHQLSQQFEGQSVIELRRFERDFIIQTYGVPPEILGIIENSNRATIEASDYIFSKRVIEPRIDYLRAVIQTKLIPQFDDRLIIDFETPALADKEFILNVAKNAYWALTIDEWREMMDKEPLPEDQGKFFMTPYNLVPSLNFGNSQTIQSEEKKIIKKSLSEDNVYELLEALDEWHIAYKVHPVYKKIIEELGQKALNEFGPGLSFNLLDPAVVQFLDEQAGIYITLVKDINETTLKELRETLIEGVRAGEGINKLADRIEAVFEDAKGYRAERIARTEVMRASNLAHYSAFSQAGIEEHEWVATRDDRVRDSHFEADGQIVKVGEPFILGSGARALYPGDPSLPRKESINCRCTVAVVIKGESFLDTEEKRKAYWWDKEMKRTKYDRLFINAIRRAFQEQQNELLRKLRELGRG